MALNLQFEIQAGSSGGSFEGEGSIQWLGIDEAAIDYPTESEIAAPTTTPFSAQGSSGFDYTQAAPIEVPDTEIIGFGPSIPEPSRALLTLLGLGAISLRRRRA